MSSRRWQIGGAIALAVAAVLAVLSLVEAYRSRRDPVTVLLAPGPEGTSLSLTAVVYGVLAGVAFFSALACFFWSAMVEARRQRAEILARLAALGQDERGPADDGPSNPNVRRRQDPGCEP